MTLSEALAEGLKVTGVGIVIVFSVLIILMLTMMAMKKIFYKDDKPKKVEAPAPVEKAEPVPAPVAMAAPAEDPNLIAVIAAAVAASLNTSTYNLQIKSYRRVKDNRPAWNKEGLRETIGNRL